MRANELLFEIRQAFSQVAPDNNHLGTAAGRIAEIADTLETLGGDPANRDVILRARAILAEKGLDISQRVISRLEALSAEILSVAGADAVRAACAPIERIGTDRSGEKMESIPSEYVLPEEYRKTHAKVADTIRNATVGVVGAALAFLFR